MAGKHALSLQHPFGWASCHLTPPSPTACAQSNEHPQSRIHAPSPRHCNAHIHRVHPQRASMRYTHMHHAFQLRPCKGAIEQTRARTHTPMHTPTHTDLISGVTWGSRWPRLSIRLRGEYNKELVRSGPPPFSSPVSAPRKTSSNITMEGVADGTVLDGIHPSLPSPAAATPDCQRADWDAGSTSLSPTQILTGRWRPASAPPSPQESGAPGRTATIPPLCKVGAAGPRWEPLTSCSCEGKSALKVRPETDEPRNSRPHARQAPHEHPGEGTHAIALVVTRPAF